MNHPSKILIVLPHSVAIRKSLLSGFVENLNSHTDLHIVGAANNKQFLSDFCSEQNIQLDFIPPIPKNPAKKSILPRLDYWIRSFGIYRLLENKHIETLSTNLKKAKEETPIVYWTRWLLWKIVFRIPLFFKLLLRWRKQLMDHEAATELIQAIKPDTILFFDIFAPQHQALILTSAELGINRIGYVRSWDNLSAKGVILYPFDYYVVWNNDMKEELLTYYNHIDPSTILQTGALEYDIAFRYKNDPSLFSFPYAKEAGNKKVITFMLSYPDAKPDFLFHLLLLLEAEKEGRLAEEIFWIVRIQPGPRSKGVRKILSEYADRIKIDSGPFLSASPSDLADLQQDYMHYLSLVQHSDMVINTTSTTTIDAFLFDTPNVTIAFDKKADEPYLSSLRRYVDRTHYRWVAECEGNKIAYNEQELIEHINSYLKDPTQDKAGRQETVSRLLSDLPGASAHTLVAHLKKQFNLTEKHFLHS